MSVAESVNAVQAMAADCSRQGYFPWYQIADGGVSKSFTNAVGLNTKSFGYQTGLPFFNTMVGVIEESGRLPGPGALASPPVSP